MFLQAYDPREQVWVAEDSETRKILGWHKELKELHSKYPDAIVYKRALEDMEQSNET